MWTIEPTSVESYFEDDEYIISIDESGTSNIEFDDNDRYFTLTAVIIKKSDFDKSLSLVNSLKNKHWKNGFYKKKKVVLHGRDLRKGNKEFSNTVVNTKELKEDVFELIRRIPIKVICIHIDKQKHKDKYTFPDDVYDLATMYLMERVSLFLNNMNKTALIMMECRGKKEDKKTLGKINRLMSNGNNYIPSSVFNKISGVYFNTKRTSCNTKSYWQIEVSDLVCYSIHRYLTVGDNAGMYKIIEKKFVTVAGVRTGLKIVY